MMRKFLGLLILAALLTACAPFSNAPLAGDLGDTWTLKMDQTGGVAGLMRSIQISADGTYRVTEERNNVTFEGQLSAADLEKLTDLLQSVRPTRVPDVQDTGCADCYVYAIEFLSGERSLTATLNDITLADSGLEQLVTFLREIMDKALS